MTLDDFHSFVRQNALWFKGAFPETSASLDLAEYELGCSLPRSMKWLLSDWGYTTACGVDGLDMTVEQTLELRQSINLPKQYIILNDWDDAGIVCWDATTPDANGEYRIFWGGSHNIGRLSEGEALDDDIIGYRDYPSWVLSRLERARDSETP